jgi:hypothetical protein
MALYHRAPMGIVETPLLLGVIVAVIALVVWLRGPGRRPTV